MNNIDYDEDMILNESRFISEEERKPHEARDCFYNTQKSKCPECDSYNTFETTYVEGCNTCGWFFGY